MSEPKSLIAYLASDDGYNHTYVSIPLTERLMKIIRTAIAVLSSHNEFSSIIVDGNVINSVSEASEQSEIAVSKIVKDLFSKDADETAIYVVSGVLPRVEPVFPILNIGLKEIYVIAIDKLNENTYGNSIPASIETNLVIPEEQ